MFITAKRRKHGRSCRANLSPWFENKKGIIQDATFIHSDPELAKADQPLKK